MATRTAYAPVASEVLTATNLAKLAGGWIGYVEITAAASSFGTSVTDITGLSVSVTVGTSRRIRVSVFAQMQSANTHLLGLLIREGATTLQIAQENMTAGDFRLFALSVILTPTAGAHTYKLSGQTSVGTATVNGAVGQPAYLLVEDIGPAA